MKNTSHCRNEIDIEVRLNQLTLYLSFSGLRRTYCSRTFVPNYIYEKHLLVNHVKKSMVLNGREIIGSPCKQKKNARTRYNYHCIKCRKPYQKHVQGCVFGTPNSGGGNKSKELNFPIKENVLPSDKSSTLEINQQLSKLKHKIVSKRN